MIRVFRVSSWRSGANRIRSYYFLRKEIDLGADKSCQIRKDFKTPFVARLNFETKKLRNIVGDFEQEIGEGSLFELESQVFAFKRLELLTPTRVFIGASILLLICLCLLWSPPKEDAACQKLSQILDPARAFTKTTSVEEKAIVDRLKEFRRALRSRNPVLASAVLHRIEEEIGSDKKYKRCDLHTKLNGLKHKLDESILLDHLEREDFDRALELWGRIQQRSQPLERRFQRDLLKMGREIAWKAWKDEERRPQESLIRQNFLDDFCESLNKEPDCFLPQLRSQFRSSMANSGEKHPKMPHEP